MTPGKTPASKGRPLEMLPIWSGHSLTESARHAIANGGNAGLLWSKFFNQWPSPAHARLCTDGNERRPCFKSAGGEEKQRWIKIFTGSRGDEQQLEAFCQRQQERVQALGGKVVRYATTAPFVVGTGLEHPVENGFLWHHVLGVPYLPGSAVKGLVRAWAQHWLEKDKDDAEVVRLLGPHMAHEKHGEAGALIFFDALPCAPVKLIAEVLTPHDGGWRQGNAEAPSDWHNPVPIPYLAVGADQSFQFAIAPRPGAKLEENDLDTAMQWLEEALEWIGAGARTTIGLGRFMNSESLPLQQGDRVYIRQEAGEKKGGGEKGTVEQVFDAQGLAKVKLDRGGKGSTPVVALEYLERL